MALTKITKQGVGADAVDATKIADDAISEEHLDNSVVTGFGDLGTNVATTDQILVYDQSAGALKKISQTNFLNFAVVSSVSPTNVVSGDGTGNHTFVITGTGFTGGSASLINSSGATVDFDSVTVNSATQITGVIAKSSLPNSGEPYDVRVTSANGLRSTLENQINVDASPVFTTSAGSLGSVVIGQAGSFSVNATDPESAGNVTFELQSGTLPPSFTITNTAAEGGTAIIAGTDSSSSSTTTFNFVLRAVDAASNTTSRAFSIQSRALTSQSFTSSGTFAVPSGITSADVLVVGGGGSGSQGANAGGGGGAGGLVYLPSYPLNPGGTVVVTIGCGGAASNSNIGNDGQDSVFGSSPSPGAAGEVLTAKGGGGGGYGSCNSGNSATNTRPGGSGGGAGRDSGGRPGSPYGGVATQPTQPGNSGAYGFGNNGGNSQASGWSGAGGGGGAGAVGGNGIGPASPWGDQGGAGGAGKAYSIADGTTSVYYAGGGGGIGAGGAGAAGQGGGGAGIIAYAPPSGTPNPNSGQSSNPGQANKGGGAGGGGQQITSGTGGKGVVIVRY